MRRRSGAVSLGPLAEKTRAKVGHGPTKNIVWLGTDQRDAPYLSDAPYLRGAACSAGLAWALNALQLDRTFHILHRRPRHKHPLTVNAAVQ